VNGQTGAILRDQDGKVVSTLTLDVLGGRIHTIRSVVNSDKLGHVGPVGGRLGDCPRGEAGSPSQGLTLRTQFGKVARLSGGQ
jgi:hypothetical protein